MFIEFFDYIFIDFITRFIFDIIIDFFFVFLFVVVLDYRLIILITIISVFVSLELLPLSLFDFAKLWFWTLFFKLFHNFFLPFLALPS